MDSVPPPFGKTTERLKGRTLAPHQFSQLTLAAWAWPGRIRSFTALDDIELASTVPVLPSTSTMGVVENSQGAEDAFSSVSAPWVSFSGTFVSTAELVSCSDWLVHGGAPAEIGTELVGEAAGVLVPVGLADGIAVPDGTLRPLVGASASPRPIPRALPIARRTRRANGVARRDELMPDRPRMRTLCP